MSSDMQPRSSSYSMDAALWSEVGLGGWGDVVVAWVLQSIVATTGATTVPECGRLTILTRLLCPQFVTKR